MQAPYAHTSDHMPPIWRAQLAAVQAGRCFWCGQPWTATTVSVEHVVPYASALWAHAPRLEQLLSLRLSHQACNHAYNAWRLTQAAPRLAALDTRLLRQVRQGIAQSPTLQLAAYHHYRAV
ncbi:hypothetical protein [Sulfobacillus sp. hq2]|uniref:hypothetical protein n=1 Tax=Sulfobacillus sp. hq2 TaxID=2039167 RepID=UPI0011AEE2E5|nr:hypothetical protein [Sulfobacillus sp. hq2]